jgi:hypothetical protein
MDFTLKLRPLFQPTFSGAACRGHKTISVPPIEIPTLQTILTEVLPQLECMSRESRA